jgi:hypothetical protein
LDNLSAFMSAHQRIRVNFGRAGRSGFHHIVAPVRHVHHPPEARYDALGGAIVIGLSIGVIILIHLILAL